MYLEWKYKNYECRIEEELEDDNVKHFHFVYLPRPDGTSIRIFADISPYDTDPKTVELWIDCNFPSRFGHSPWTKKTLTIVKEALDKATELQIGHRPGQLEDPRQMDFYKANNQETLNG